MTKEHDNDTKGPVERQDLFVNASRKEIYKQSMIFRKGMV